MKPTFFNINLFLRRLEISASLILFLNLFVSSQANLAKNWQFSNNNALVFNGGTPSYSAGSVLSNSLGSAAISDLAGNLLFYSDGVTIYNSANAVMSNGTGLDGVNASQPAVILKQPGNTNLYYVFTVGGYSTNIGLKYSIVDMSLAAGMGSVTAKNILIDNNCRDKLTAGKHCNGSDLWIVSTYSSSAFAYCSAPLTPTGVGSPITGTISSALGVVNPGQIKLSPNSRKFALSCFRNPIPSAGSILRMIADFNNATGQITIANYLYPYYWSYTNNAVTMADAYGIEFSTNSQYIYTNSAIQMIVKIGLCDSSESYVLLQESSNQVDIYGNKKQFQLAPNGNIYVARSGTTAIGRINSPSSASATSYTPNSVSTISNSCQWGLPNFPGFYFEQKPNLSFTYTSNITCLTASFSTEPPCSRSGYAVIGYKWVFGDPLSAGANTSFAQNPGHAFSATGSYTVSLIRFFLCNTNDTVSQIVNVTQPILSTGTSTNCFGTTATVQAIGGAGPYTYLWSSNSQTNSVAFFTTSAIYSVTVTDQGAGNCVRIATISVNVPTITIATAISPTILCFGASNAQVTVNVTGGSGSYMYNYAQTTQSSQIIGNLFAGTHTITITDFGFSCVLTKTFAIASAPPITLYSGASPSLTCEGGSVAIISNASGGLGSISYSWSPIVTSNSSFSITPLPGNYTFTVSAADSLACTATRTISFVVNPKPNISVPSVSTCIGSQVTLSASGASSFTWMPGALIGSLITVTANANAVYTITGKNNFNCVNTNTVLLTSVLPNTVAAGCNSPLCVGQNANFYAGSINAYQWAGPNGFISGQQNPQINNSQQNNSGNYTLVTTDANSCKNTLLINLLVNAPPQVSILAYTNTICQGQNLSLSAFGAYTYTWMNGGTGSTTLISPLTNTIIQVTGTDSLTKCNATATWTVTVKKCNPAGLEGYTNDDVLFQIFPNPNHGNFTIHSGAEGSYVILNVLGEIVSEGTLIQGDNNIELLNRAKGIYIIYPFFKTPTSPKKVNID